MGFVKYYLVLDVLTYQVVIWFKFVNGETRSITKIVAAS
jgi:hypothetical protein